MNVQPMVYNLCGIFFKSLSSATKTTKNKTTKTIDKHKQIKTQTKKDKKNNLPLTPYLSFATSALWEAFCNT